MKTLNKWKVGDIGYYKTPEGEVGMLSDGPVTLRSKMSIGSAGAWEMTWQSLVNGEQYITESSDNIYKLNAPSDQSVDTFTRGELVLSCDDNTWYEIAMVHTPPGEDGLSGDTMLIRTFGKDSKKCHVIWHDWLRVVPDYPPVPDKRVIPMSPGEMSAADKKAEPSSPNYHDHPLYPVLMKVIEQATKGKGERHGGDSIPFMDQPWKHYADMHGRGFLTGQAAKKLEEAVSKPLNTQFEDEVLGAIAYAAMAILHTWDKS